MRAIALAAVLIAGAVGVGCEKQPIVETHYPWCLRTDLNGGIDNCAFDSLEQCKETLGVASRGSCVENPWYRQQQQSSPPPLR